MQKILAIHHQEASLTGFVERLKQLFPGIKVVPAYSWEEGLAEAQLRKPDAIVFGNTRPVDEKKRNQVCRILKTSQTTSHIPLMICHFNGNSDESPPLPRELDEAVDIFLSKPVDDQELQYHINTMLRLKETDERLLNQNELLEKTVSQRTRALEAELEERKRIEEELRQSEEKYRQLIQSSNDGIYLLFNRKFEIVNQKFLEMLAVTEESVRRPDFDFMQLVAHSSRPFIEERYRKIALGQPVDSKYEFTALTRDGRQLEVEASVTFIPYKGGIATQGILRDITRRKEAESYLRQAQKIEAISTLAGGIAHDFNNILAIIRGYTELVMDDMPVESSPAHNLKHVLDAADRARELVNQIITFSRQGDENREPVCISQIANQVLSDLRTSLPNYITIKDYIETDAGIVMGDPTQLRQVLVNLCSNAIYAMRDSGGILELGLEKIDIPPTGYPGLKNALPGPYIKLTVKDTGHGMGKDVAERIFEPYFTTRATGEGSGLGLAVIYGIVKTLGGDIAVQTEPDKGTSFYLYLPRIDSASKTNANSRPKTPYRDALPSGNERILLVEDENHMIHIQQEILEPLGYHVMAASKCIEALDMFRADTEIFDLIIVNQNMPDMAGIHLASEILKIKPTIPVVLSIGFSDTLNREAAIKTGISAFIMKPVIQREVAGIIRDVLNNWKKEE